MLDQFEQWLHAHPVNVGLPLTDGLRQCNGERLQCLLLVRQDYAFSVTRFLLALETPLTLGDNWQVVPRFGLDHARKVLTAFGRAMGQLPREPDELSAEQQAFVEGAVTGLAEQEEVVPVRLALFADMFKSRRWTAAGLVAVGGAEGVGRAFLEQTFEAEDAPAHYRLHAKGARKVLEALLPEVGSDIKGHWRSREELVAAAGYERRPAEAEQLLRILDKELRLVSPVENKEVFLEGEEPGEEDVAGRDAAVATVSADAGRKKNYHLTHDYLVPSLRSWLEDLLGRTPEGRAKRLLRERSRVWNTQPLNRHL
ncbi:MAG: serine/threonine protein kinase, partial [Planctomycetaceae bacterium]